jgi:hypothetical protein
MSNLLPTHASKHNILYLASIRDYISSVPIGDFAVANEESWQEWLLSNYYIHVVERLFVKGVITPSISLEIMQSARFAIPTPR